MLKFEANPTFLWPVIVQVPQDGGRKAAVQFSARFRVLPAERIAELVRPVAGGPAVADRALLAAVVAGWDQVVDEQGSAIPFSDETLAAVGAVPYIRTALIDAYSAAINGKPVPAAQLGN